MYIILQYSLILKMFILNLVSSKCHALSMEPVKTYSAVEMCHKYSNSTYLYEKKTISNLTSSNRYTKIEDCHDVDFIPLVENNRAFPKEFPHMALISYDEKVENATWTCGGSLISNKWILTAAHCEIRTQTKYARWARLGDMSYLSDIYNVKPIDYKIVKRIVHPDFKPPSRYNDIALFGLEKDVEFSPYIRPICLNTDQLLRPSTTIIIKWPIGDTYDYRKQTSLHLLKYNLNIIPTSQCNTSYFSKYNSRTLEHGIIDDSMICAGDLLSRTELYNEDTGGPLQIIQSKNKCMYIQIGIKSFEQPYSRYPLFVFTKVSKYISWIEKIVWPKVD